MDWSFLTGLKAPKVPEPAVPPVVARSAADQELIDWQKRELANYSDLLRRADESCAARVRESREKGRLAAELLVERDAAHGALREIAALETPNCAHVGKKMAAIAKAALPGAVVGEKG